MQGPTGGANVLSGLFERQRIATRPGCIFQRNNGIIGHNPCDYVLGDCVPAFFVDVAAAPLDHAPAKARTACVAGGGDMSVSALMRAFLRKMKGNVGDDRYTRLSQKSREACPCRSHHFGRETCLDYVQTWAETEDSQAPWRRRLGGSHARLTGSGSRSCSRPRVWPRRVQQWYSPSRHNVVIMKREMSGETIRVKISGDQARTAVQNTATASRSPEQATTCFRGVLQQ